MQFQARLTQDYRDTMFRGTAMLTYVPTNGTYPQFQIRVPKDEANQQELGEVYTFTVTRAETQPEPTAES